MGTASTRGTAKKDISTHFFKIDFFNSFHLIRSFAVSKLALTWAAGTSAIPGDRAGIFVSDGGPPVPTCCQPHRGSELSPAPCRTLPPGLSPRQNKDHVWCLCKGDCGSTRPGQTSAQDHGPSQQAPVALPAAGPAVPCPEELLGFCPGPFSAACPEVKAEPSPLGQVRTPGGPPAQGRGQGELGPQLYGTERCKWDSAGSQQQSADAPIN